MVFDVDVARDDDDARDAKRRPERGVSDEDKRGLAFGVRLLVLFDTEEIGVRGTEGRRCL